MLAATLGVPITSPAQTLPAEAAWCGTTTPEGGPSTHVQDGPVVRALLVLVRFPDDPIEDAVYNRVPGWNTGSNRHTLPGFATTLLAPTQAAITSSDSSISRYYYEQSKLTSTGPGQLQFFGEVWPRDGAGQPYVYVAQHNNNWYHAASGKGYGYLTQEILDFLDTQPGFDIGNFDLNNDGWLDEMILLVRSEERHRARGGTLTYSGCATLDGCFELEGSPGPLSYQTKSNPSRSVGVHWTYSGTHNFAQTPGTTVAQFHYVRTLSHEWGHHLWAHHFNFHIRADAFNDVPVNNTYRLGYALMAGGSTGESLNIGASETISPFERDLIGIAACQKPTGAPTQTVTLRDLYGSADCFEFPVGLRPGGGDTVFVSNLQRNGFFSQLRTGEIRPDGPFGTQPFAEDGLMTTGVQVGIKRVSGPEWYQLAYDELPADNTLNPSTYSPAYQGDLHGPSHRTQVTPWTRPNVNGYTVARPGGSWAAIDNIRYTGGAGGEMAFDYVQDFRAHPTIRANSWIGPETAGHTIPGNVLVKTGATLDVDVDDGNTANGNETLTFAGTFRAETGATVLLGGPGQTITFNQDVTFDPNSTLRVRQGTKVRFEDNVVLRAYAGSVVTVEPGVTFEMEPNAQLASWGRIEAVGTSASPIRFQRTNPAAAWSTSNAWREVTLLGNDNHFKYVVFEGGNPNLTVASRNNLFQFCRFKNAWRGLSSWTTLTSGRSQFRIEDSIIESNNTVGLVGYMADIELKRTTLQNNPQTAVTLQSSADITELNYSRSTGNAAGGLYLSSGSDVYMPPYGLNRLYNDGGPELTIPYGGYVSGLDYSRSSIFHTSGSPPSGAYVVNNSGATLYANETYWGGGAPLASWFSPSGSVYAPNPLTSEWATGAGPSGAVPLYRGVEGPTLTTDGAVSAADDARRWVRDHADDPSAPTRLWALYGSHRRPDATGNVAAERSADAALFADLAGRLADGRSLTGVARRTAETALALAVRSAMKDGRYDESRALLDRHLSRVESRDIARALRFDRVTLLGLQDRTDEALELLAALEAEDPDDRAPQMIRETIASTAWIRAAAQAGAASETEGVRAALTPSDVPATFEATAYPNPARDRVVVRYALPESATARVELYDALGRRVAHLADGTRGAGRYEAPLELSTLPAGLYLWRVSAGAHVQTGRVVVVK